MGIDYSFHAEVTDKAKALRAIREITENIELKITENADSLCIEFCRFGTLYLNFTMESGHAVLEGEARTNLAGAGFHKAVVDFTDALLMRAGLQAGVEDETEYDTERNFDKLQGYMYSWLNSVILLCERQSKEENSGDFGICWDIGQYHPELIEDTIYSPFGRFHIPTVVERIKKEGIEPFAKEFFIWNEREKDAGYYLKTALSKLWEDCYFMPGSRSKEDRKLNQEIIRLLETAAGMDPVIPFPKEDYLLLCRLNKTIPIPLENRMELKTKYPIGFRKGIVTHRIGGFALKLPGYYLMEEEELERGFDYIWYDGLEENWHSFRLTSFEARNGVAQFSDRIFEDMEEHYTEYQAGDGRGRAAFAGEVEDEDGNCFYQSLAQLICENKMLIVTASYEREEEKENVLRILMQITGLKKRESLT